MSHAFTNIVSFNLHNSQQDGWNFPYFIDEEIEVQGSNWSKLQN